MTEIKHGDPKFFPPREKGIMSIFEFSQKKKKQKVEKKPEPDTSPSKSNVTSTSLLSRLSSAVSSLFELLNPFRNAVSSLEKSADKIEKLLQDKDEARVRQLRTYSNHETFGLEHKNEGLIVRASNGQFYGGESLGGAFITDHGYRSWNFKKIKVGLIVMGWIIHH